MWKQLQPGRVHHCIQGTGSTIRALISTALHNLCTCKIIQKRMMTMPISTALHNLCTWIDQAGLVWKVGGRGDPAMCPDGVCPDCFQTKKEKRELEQKTTTASSSQQPPASIQQPANP